MRSIGPRAKDVDLWIFIWEDLHRVHQEGILVEVEARQKRIAVRRKMQMSLFRKIITEGNAKADEPAKDGAMMDGGVNVAY